MLLPHVGNQADFAPLLLLSTDHNGRAVGVVGTDVDATLATQFLEANPYVSLDVFDQMAQMDRAIGVRKSCCDKDFRVAHYGRSYSRCEGRVGGRILVKPSHGPQSAIAAESHSTSFDTRGQAVAIDLQHKDGLDRLSESLFLQGVRRERQSHKSN
jgi:hypothetical protein